VELYKSSLADTIRRAYFASGNQSLLHVIENDGSERFLKKIDSLDDMRQKIIDVVNKVESAKQLQEKKKNELIELKKEKEKLLVEHKEIESTLLVQSTNVQTEIGRVDASIAELNAKLSAVENQLSSLLGISFDTDDIVKAAKFASKKTGVRKDFILGMLVVETNLGRFTGGCNYKESRMSDYRKDIFKDICKGLDYNYKKQKVSCPPANYKGTGGAMGVAQFMSDTWKGYESKIARATGHNPPDPWSLTDGVMAMALKLANDGATKKSGEWKAASRYLGTCSTANTKFYCEDVLWWADNYEKKL
jgi:transglycosylase-like protein with SLT domain